MQENDESVGNVRTGKTARWGNQDQVGGKRNGGAALYERGTPMLTHC